MIEIQDIRKSFGDKVVLDGISGTFERGKTNLIIGASGTGKSVLMKCMVGIIQPDSGRVTFDDRPFTDGSEELRKEIRQEVGMLFQGGALFDYMTVEENVMFPLNVLTRMNKSDKLERVNFCLHRVGLEGSNKLMPSELSGGMKKRVGIARAIALKDSKYLFCDEPNSGLDPITSIKIDNLIQEITHEYDITTIVVTHDMNSVMEIGEHVLFLHEGKKLWEGNNDAILESGIPELEAFIFANRLLREYHKNKES